MRDVLVVTGVIAFFVLGAAYIALCARILADAGNIDEAIADDEADEADEADRDDAEVEDLVAR